MPRSVERPKKSDDTAETHKFATALLQLMETKREQGNKKRPRHTVDYILSKMSNMRAYSAITGRRKKTNVFVDVFVRTCIRVRCHRYAAAVTVVAAAKKVA